MEINKFTDIMGVVTTEDIPEGRMVLITPNTVPAGGHNFGSRTDLPGVKLPADSTEAGLAKFCITWPVNNATAHDPITMFIPQPAFDWATRGGWEQARNVPFTSKVYLSYPGHWHGETIPSGWLALAFDRGVFTVPSGQFQYSANLVTGAPLEVLNTADDGASLAGVLAYNAAGTIAVVERFNSDDFTLTFRTL